MNASLVPPAAARGMKRVPPATLLTLLAVIAVLLGGGSLGHLMLTSAWTKAVTVVGFSVLLLAMWFRPALGLLLWVLLLPFAGHIYLKIDLGSLLPDLDISRFGMLVLSLRLVTRATVFGRRSSSGATWRLLPLTSPEIAMACFALGIALSFRPSAGSGVLREILTFIAVPMLMYFIAPGVVFYLGRTLLRSRAGLMATVWMVGITGMLLGIISIREQLTGLSVFSSLSYSVVYEGNLRKVLSLFGSPSLMTTALSVPVPLLIYGLRQVQAFGSRVLLGLFLLVSLAGNFFVFVRAGWLGAVSAILILAVLSPGIRRVFLRVLPIILLIGALAIFLVVTPEVVSNRLSSSAPVDYRLTAWGIAWDLFIRSPITGSGFETFGAAAISEFGWTPHDVIGYLPTPHNSYLYVLASGGLLAFLPYVAIFVTVAWRGLAFWRFAPCRDLVAVLWATLIAYMLINGTLDALNAHYTNVLLFLILGALVGRLEQLQVEAPA